MTDWQVPLAPPRRASRPTATARIDLKRGGVLPIANLARLHALSAGVTISATLDRLRGGASELGRSTRETATGAARGVRASSARLRIGTTRRASARGRPPDNAIAPAHAPAAAPAPSSSGAARDRRRAEAHPGVRPAEALMTCGSVHTLWAQTMRPIAIDRGVSPH